MVSLLIPPVGPEAHSAAFGLTARERKGLQDLYKKTVEVLAPVARVSSQAGLEAVLAGVMLPWARLARRTLELLLATPAGRKHWEQAQLIDAEALATAKAELLGEPASSQFLGAFESLQGMTEWALPRLQAGSPGAQVAILVQGLTGEHLLRAQIVLSAVVLILNDGFSDWTPEAVPLLCAAADEYMTRVEDVVFSMASLPGEREFIEIGDG